MLQSTIQFPIAFPLRAAASGTSDCPIDVVYREVLGTKWRGPRALVVSLSNHPRNDAAFFVSFEQNSNRSTKLELVLRSMRITLEARLFLLGRRTRMDQREAMMKNPGTAAVLSFLIPGVGQIYNGTFWRAIFWLIITPGLWIGSGGTLGWICHIISAYTAYSYAKNQPQGQLQHT